MVAAARKDRAMSSLNFLVEEMREEVHAQLEIVEMFAPRDDLRCRKQEGLESLKALLLVTPTG